MNECDFNELMNQFSFWLSILSAAFASYSYGRLRFFKERLQRSDDLLVKSADATKFWHQACLQLQQELAQRNGENHGQH